MLVMAIQVVARGMRQVSRLREAEAILFNQLSTDHGMWKELTIICTRRRFFLREDGIDCSHRPLGPEAPGLLIHLILEDGLHQAVDGQRVSIERATYQRMAS